MKILIVTRSFVREISDLVKYITEHSGQTWQFHLVFPHDAKVEETLPASVSLRRIYFPHKIRMACYGPSLLLDFVNPRPDIVHVFEEFSGLLAFQAFAFKALTALASKMMVYSAENILHNIRPTLHTTTNYVMRRADMAFVCSKGVKKVLQREGFSAPIEVVPLGVNPRLFYKSSADTLKQQLKLDGKFIIGYVGRLLQMKGIFLLIDLLPQLPEYVHLVFLGSGPEEQHLREASMQAGVEDRVHLLGNIPYSELPNYINCMDIGLVPSQTASRWKEQFGRSIVELMSCEVPVIGSDSGAIPEVVQDGGLIFPEGDCQKLLAQVRMLMHSPEKRREYGTRGREIAVKHYSIESMGEKFLRLYRQLSPT